MSFLIDIDEKSRKAGRFITHVHHQLQDALSRSGLRQQQVADKLGIDRSVINRRILGETNLTLRSLAELAWALDHDIKCDLVPKIREQGSNSFIESFDRNVTEEDNTVVTVEIETADQPQMTETNTQHYELEYAN